LRGVETVRKRLPVSWDRARGFHVALPTYMMIPGTWQPVTPGLVHENGAEPSAKPADVIALDVSVLCDFPDADAHPLTGQPSDLVIMTRYENHSVFGGGEYVAPKTKGAPVAAGERPFVAVADLSEVADAEIIA
jgi:hypothetical protein